MAGNITSAVPGLKAADIEIVPTDAQCGRTNTGFKCVIESTATNPRITVSNYFKLGKVLLACSDELTVHGQEHSGESLTNNWTRFNLPAASTSTAHIVIREDSC